MIRSGVRVAATAAAVATVTLLGAGLAAAAPTVSADTSEEGAVVVGSRPEGEQWMCVLAGAGAQTMLRVDIARAGESRGDFAAGTTVGAGCVSTAPFGATVVTGNASLDDAD